MIAVLLVLLMTPVSTATVAPMDTAPAAPMGNVWTTMEAADSSTYASFKRREGDGTDSIVSGSRQVCDCQPSHAMQMLQSILRTLPGVTLKRDRLTVCGAPAERLIATGLAAPANERKNMEVILFRREPALYSLNYNFRYGAPMADAETFMRTLCR